MIIGTLINVGAILAGSIVGVFLGGRLPERVKQTVISGIGLFVLVLGFQMFLKTQNSLYVLGGLIIGVILGEILRIEDGLQNLGGFFERHFMKTQENQVSSETSNFIRGFLTASLLFCIGPMAILGSIQDGLAANHELLIVKSILDGFSSLAFASSLGIGVLFSSLIVLVYQGSISLLAAQFQTVFSNSMMNEMTAVGGLILVGIAISSLLEIKKIRMGNFLPALVITPLLVALVALFG